MLGTINPVAEIARLAHDAGAVVLVDGAQAAPKLALDVGEIGADFYAFTGHKAYGPTGVGVLRGRRDLLEAMGPFMGGGSMIRTVRRDEITWADLPARFEAGTPPIGEAIGLAAAIEWLEEIGLDAVHARDAELATYALRRLSEVPGLRVFGPPPARTAAGSFRSSSRASIPTTCPRSSTDTRSACARVTTARRCYGAARRRRDHAGELRRLQHARGDRSPRRRAPRRPPGVPARLIVDEQLYREQILEHYKHPQNFGRLDEFDLEFEDSNPFCGDEQHVDKARRRGPGDRGGLRGKGLRDLDRRNLAADRGAGDDARGASASRRNSSSSCSGSISRRRG